MTISPVSTPLSTPGIRRPWHANNLVSLNDGRSVESGEQTGRGPGELKFVEELRLHGISSESFGSQRGYDIVDSLGNRWEVKCPNKKRLIVATGAGELTRRFFAMISEVLVQMEALLGILDQRGLQIDPGGITNDLARQVVARLIKVFSNTSGSPSRGYFYGNTPKNPVGFEQMLDKFHLLLQSVPDEHPWGTIRVARRTLTISDAEMFVLLDTMRKDGRMNQTDVFECFPGPRIVSAILNNGWFQNPSAFLSTHFMLDSHFAFGDVTGIVLVDKDGYMIVPRDDFDKFKFAGSFARGKPEYRVDGHKAWHKPSETPN